MFQFVLYAPPILSLRGPVALGPWLRLLGVSIPQSFPINVLLFLVFFGIVNFLRIGYVWYVNENDLDDNT